MNSPSRRWSDESRRYDIPHLRLRQVAALVNQYSPRRLLDVGCASGYLQELCPGAEYYGCDFVTPTQPPPFPFFLCDLNRQPLPRELRDFDAVVCSGILEYVEDVPGFLSQIRERLCRDGVLIATYYNMNHVSRMWAMIRGVTFADHPDWRGFYSLRDMRRFIRDCGFVMDQEIAMNHTWRKSTEVERTVTQQLSLERIHPWSFLLSHQFHFVARPRAVSPANTPARP